MFSNKKALHVIIDDVEDADRDPCRKGETSVDIPACLLPVLADGRKQVLILVVPPLLFFIPVK